MVNGDSVWASVVDAALQQQSAAQRLRQRRTNTPISAVEVAIAGRRLVNFASNNYLGLTHHPRVISAMQKASARAGAGSGAAALVSGYTSDHAAAETAIRQWKGSEAALLMGSGFNANLAAIHAVAAVARAGARSVRFLLDKLAHASLVDAVRSAAQSTDVSYRVFPHNHVAKLKRLLSESPVEQLQVVVTESIFSMDGDAADLPALAALKVEKDFLLIVDEAHGSGVYGPGGAGYAAELGLGSLADLTVLTLSKAVGVAGGAICASANWCEAIVNLARAYVYTTNLPPAVAAGITAALSVMSDEPERQRRVRDLALHVRATLRGKGLLATAGDSPIVPILLGSEEAALAASQRLFHAGLLVPAIRPPTVAKGTSRLRVTLSSAHTDNHVEQLISELNRIERTT